MENEEATCQACPLDQFCLGMCSWTGCPGNADVVVSGPHLPDDTGSVPLQPHPSSASANLPHSSSASGRFKLVSDQELSKLADGLVPQNTAKMTGWALKNFQEWMANRSNCNPSDPVPDDILQCTDPVTLSFKVCCRDKKSKWRSLSSCYTPPTPLWHSQAHEE